jgi:sporulation protein YlmC with PRC-barrel domain
MLIRTMIVAFLLSFTTVGQAQMRNVADEGALEMAELFGAPVFAWDGAEVGKVLDVLFDHEGQPLRLRMTGAANLGLGERTIEVPKGTFILLRGAAVLELPSEAVEALPEIYDGASEE